MEKPSSRTLTYGLLALASMLLSSVGYLYGHKLLNPNAVTGAVSAIWQVLVAAIWLSLAGGLGERLLGDSVPRGLVRLGLAAALGVIVLSLGTLLVGATIGTTFVVGLAELVLVAALVFRAMPAWWRNLVELPLSLDRRYEKSLALGVLIVLVLGLASSLAPPTEFDTLVYHLSLPLAYVQHGRVLYLPDTMFWGMPQLTEMLYVPLMSLAGAQAAAVFILLIGAVSLATLLGYSRSLFGNAAAWTSVVALVIGENLAHSLSTAYVDWMSIFFGIAALVALHLWRQEQNRKMLLLSGIFCGGALGTKYTAGVLLIGVLVTLVIDRRGRPVRAVMSSILVVALGVIVITIPWWIKNTLATGNPFYPFFFASGAMDQYRLDFYQKVPVRQDWRAVALLPWQATFWGIDGKDGFATSIGSLLIGLSPLAWVSWHSRSEAQKLAIRSSAIITLGGFVIWAVASRISGLLIQTRLYLAFFPAWAVLAGAGFDAVAGLSSRTVRFGRLLIVLIAAMFGLSLFSMLTNSVSRNPALYILRQEDEKSYLFRTLGAYAAAMDAVNQLPTDAQVLMLWETRGYYCQPRCDSDEVIDRWYDDARLYGTGQAIVQAWHAQGYTELLVYNLGMDFVRTYYNPEDQQMHWSMLTQTLKDLPVEQQIAGGSYTLYRIP
jgi:4-amino-4-deoxy-L-arabinose transferase-like glycosyltransferase